jgi:hypothetical protein
MKKKVSSKKKDPSSLPGLRLFVGEDAGPLSHPGQIPVPLAEFSRIVTDALKSNRSWLDDFRDEDVLVSADLFEVLNAYAHLRPAG